MSQKSQRVESNRVRLDYSFNPHFAVSSGVIEPLPHRIEAEIKAVQFQVSLKAWRTVATQADA